jgi:hypothetical protein
MDRARRNTNAALNGRRVKEEVRNECFNLRISKPTERRDQTSSKFSRNTARVDYSWDITLVLTLQCQYRGSKQSSCFRVAQSFAAYLPTDFTGDSQPINVSIDAVIQTGKVS